MTHPTRCTRCDQFGATKAKPFGRSDSEFNKDVGVGLQLHAFSDQSRSQCFHHSHEPGDIAAAGVIFGYAVHKGLVDFDDLPRPHELAAARE